MSRMPGRGKSGPHRVRHLKAKQQKKKFIRSKDPILSVFMWGVQHSINELTTSIEPSLLLPEDFKAFSKIRVENQFYNKENLPGHFKFKEYCPRVFHDLRKRFRIDDLEYMHSIVSQPPKPIDSPGRSGARFFNSYDRRVVMKSITSEEVALLHQILQPYHAHVVTTEGRTLLPQYLGMYRLTVNNAETYWMVMRNVFSSTVTIHRKFDLKGSRVDRAASHKEKAKINPTLKDNDFTESGEKIIIGEEAKTDLMRTLECDVQLLQKLNLMDYSLLVGIYDGTIPPDPDDEDDEGEGEEGNGYLSNDDLGEGPHSPHSPIPGEELMCSGEVLDSPDPQVPQAEVLPANVQDPVVPETTETAMDTKPESPTDDDARTDEVAGAVAYTSKPAVVDGEKAVEAALAEGLFPIIDKSVDVFAVPSAEGVKPQVYFMALIDVLTNYGARKRAAHAAKTMKHGAGAEISTVRPEQYSRRFLEFLSKIID